MTTDAVVEILRHALLAAFWIAAPLLAVGFAAGILISLAQIVTSIQDTGFSTNYPVGEGLLAFRTLDEAVRGAQQIAGDYERHSRAARALAEAYFDSDKVLRRVLEEAS